jgi:hypothetical protein
VITMTENKKKENIDKNTQFTWNIYINISS